MPSLVSHIKGMIWTQKLENKSRDIDHAKTESWL